MQSALSLRHSAGASSFLQIRKWTVFSLLSYQFLWVLNLFGHFHLSVHSVFAGSSLVRLQILLSIFYHDRWQSNVLWIKRKGIHRILGAIEFWKSSANSKSPNVKDQTVHHFNHILGNPFRHTTWNNGSFAWVCQFGFVWEKLGRKRQDFLTFLSLRKSKLMALQKPLYFSHRIQVKINWVSKREREDYELTAW